MEWKQRGCGYVVASKGMFSVVLLRKIVSCLLPGPVVFVCRRVRFGSARAMSAYTLGSREVHTCTRVRTVFVV